MGTRPPAARRVVSTPFSTRSGVRNKASGRFAGFRSLPGHFRLCFGAVSEHFGTISDILGPFRRQVWQAERLSRKLT